MQFHLIPDPSSQNFTKSQPFLYTHTLNKIHIIKKYENCLEYIKNSLQYNNCVKLGTH